MAMSDHALERFRVLNGLGPHDRLKPGEKVKIVVSRVPVFRTRCSSAVVHRSPGPSYASCLICKLAPGLQRAASRSAAPGGNDREA